LLGNWPKTRGEISFFCDMPTRPRQADLTVSLILDIPFACHWGSSEPPQCNNPPILCQITMRKCGVKRRELLCSQKWHRHLRFIMVSVVTGICFDWLLFIKAPQCHKSTGTAKQSRDGFERPSCWSWHAHCFCTGLLLWFESDSCIVSNTHVAIILQNVSSERLLWAALEAVIMVNASHSLIFRHGMRETPWEGQRATFRIYSPKHLIFVINKKINREMTFVANTICLLGKFFEFQIFDVFVSFYSWIFWISIFWWMKICALNKIKRLYKWLT